MDKPWKVIAAFIGVFIAGAVFGGFLAMGIGSRVLPAAAPSTQAVTSVPAVEQPAPTQAEQKSATAPQPQAKAEQPKPPQPRPPLIQVPFAWQEPQLMRRYADRLDLTADQKNKINPVIQRALEDYRRLQQNHLRETSIIVQRMQADIRKELTPDQITELDKMEQRQRDIMEKAEQRQRDLQKAEQQKKKGPGAQKGPNEKRPKNAPAQPAPTGTTSTSPSASTSTAPAATPTTTAVAPAAAAAGSSTEATSTVVTPTK